MDNIVNFFNPSKKMINKLPDEEKQISQILHDLGYKLEEHEVTTQDGYILTLFRIKGRKFLQGDLSQTTKRPVLFQHGLLDSSDGWLCNEEHLNLPLILCNLGYDIWLSNSRGNKYSRKHRIYNPDKDYEFWAYSFEEMGKFDIPAVFDYILSINTKYSKLHYIGHSQGTCLMFSAIATQSLTDYLRDKIEIFIALAPVAKVGNMKSTLLNIVHTLKASKFFHEEVFPAVNSSFTNWINTNLPSLSHSVLDLISDDKSAKVNNTKRLPVFLSHYPSGTSLKSINHFNQMLKSKRFQKYDYGHEANVHIYKSKTPEEYDLKSVKGYKIVLVSGDNDKLSTPEDVKWINEELSVNKNVIYYKNYKDMGHISFLLGLEINWFLDLIEFVHDLDQNLGLEVRSSNDMELK